MRVLFYRQFVCHDGIASWMLTVASELDRLGVTCSFWFPKIFYQPIHDFERLGPVYTSPPHEAAAVLRTSSCDAVHVVNSDYTADVFGLLDRAPRIITTSHGDLADGWDASNCFAYTAVSEDMTVLNQPMTRLKIDTVPNGIDAERFFPPPTNLQPGSIVAWVGRSMDPRKDFARFTRVAATLAARGVRAWVADAHGASWQNFSGDECVRFDIERWEQVPIALMPQFYRDLASQGGVLLMTSRHEGWGLAAVEAAACGVPTVAPDVVGLRRAIIPGVTGELYAIDSSDQVVADRVHTWLQRGRDEWSPEKCAAAARASFSAEKMARSYLDIYRRSQTEVLMPHIKRPDSRQRPPARLARRLAEFRWHRAAFLADLARTWANGRQRSMGWRALRRSVATAPRSAFHPRRAGQLLTTMSLIVGKI
jgi:glycosyltransferase involved in cell wall biosynthesis